MLTVPSSGTDGNNITFGNYGEGNAPIILGSEKALDFTNTTGNIAL